MRTNIDFSPFRRSTVGFDRLFDVMESGASNQTNDNYPPFDLEKEDNDHYRISVAVAGFRQDELDITSQQNLLIVSGRKQDDKKTQYVHRGIAARTFERRFVLGDYIKVRNAELKDGLLTIDLVREVPEEVKPRKIQIGGSQETITQQDASSGNGDQRQAA